MKFLKIISIMFVSVLVTALGIDAADTIGGVKGTLLSQVIGQDSGCPKGMAEVENVTGVSCFDVYEVTPSESCTSRNPQSTFDTMANIDNQSCSAVSEKSAEPWRFITRDQAMQLCAREGKRLPTAKEWYGLSLGSNNAEDSCNVSSSKIAKTGSFESCVSPQGAYDMIGNVWEWVSDDVIHGQFENRKLPQTGYVAQVDGAGIAVNTKETEQELFNADFFWSKEEGVYGIMRGGFYGSGSDAGVYTVHADTLPTFAGAAIGFRCVK